MSEHGEEQHVEQEAPEYRDALSFMQRSIDNFRYVKESLEVHRAAALDSIKKGIEVCERESLESVPDWATPAGGGNNVGAFAASGPPLPHEIDLYLFFKQLQGMDEMGQDAAQEEQGSERKLPVGVSTEDMREMINMQFCSFPGFHILTWFMEDRRGPLFTCKVPEEGALCVVAALRATKRCREAEQLLETISPFFRHLRFYPQLKVTRKHPYVGPREVHRDPVTVRYVDYWLKHHCVTPDRITEMKHTIETLLPLYDEAVMLFMETLGDGEDMPAVGQDGKVTGGLPCSRIPDSWQDRADDLSHRMRDAIGDRKLSDQRSLKRLAKHLECPVKELSDGQVSDIRRILANVNSARGLPGTSAHVEYREDQQAAMSKVGGEKDMAEAVRERIKKHAEEDIRADPEIVLGPVTEEEAVAYPALAVGRVVQPRISRTVRMLLAPPQEVPQVVKSDAEDFDSSFDHFIPQLFALVDMADFAYPLYKMTYSQILLAFAYSCRLKPPFDVTNDASLEVLSQFDELPWVKSLRWKPESALTSLVNRVRGLATALVS